MRRGTMLVLGLLMASTAMPQTADARPLIFKMLGGVTRPTRRDCGRRPARQPAGGAPRRPERRAGGAADRAAPAAAAGRRSGARCQRATAIGRDLPHRRRLAAAPPAPPQRDATRAGPAPSATCRGREAATPVAPAPARNPASARSVRWPGRAPTRMSSASRCGRRNTANGCASTASATCSAPRSHRAHRLPRGHGRTCSRRGPTRQPEPPCAVAPAAASICTSADWPIAQIASAIELNDAQRGTLDQLKTALSDAVVVASSRPAATTPISRRWNGCARCRTRCGRCTTRRSSSARRSPSSTTR